MKILKKELLTPLVFTVIPANVLGVLYVSELSEEPYNYMVSYPTMLFGLISLVSLLLIGIFKIKFKEAYKRMFITSLLLFVGVIASILPMVLFSEKKVSLFLVIAYPIVSTLIIINKVRLILKKLSESQTDKHKLSHILLIAFINPLLPFLPFLMTTVYEIVYFSDNFGLK